MIVTRQCHARTNNPFPFLVTFSYLIYNGKPREKKAARRFRIAHDFDRLTSKSKYFIEQQR